MEHVTIVLKSEGMELAVATAGLEKGGDALCQVLATRMLAEMERLVEEMKNESE